MIASDVASSLRGMIGRLLKAGLINLNEIHEVSRVLLVIDAAEREWQKARDEAKIPVEE